MIATSCFPYHQVETEAYPAPDLLTDLIPEAEYMIATGAGHGVYALVPQEEETVRPGQEFCHYYVDGRLFQAIYTTTGEEYLPAAIETEPAVQDDFYQYSFFEMM